MEFADNEDSRILLISEMPTVFTVSLPDDGKRVVRLRRSFVLSYRRETFESLRGVFDVCCIELGEGELENAGELVDSTLLLMKPNGLIIVSVYNRRGHDRAGFVDRISF